MLSWKPERKGDIYCAPACGAKCTWQAFVAARSAGQALANRLTRNLPFGVWTFQVKENMKWFYQATSESGHMKVHTSFGGNYMAFLGEPGLGGKWAEHGDTPEEAIHNVLQVAREHRAYIQSLIAPFEV